MWNFRLNTLFIGSCFSIFILGCGTDVQDSECECPPVECPSTDQVNTQSLQNKLELEVKPEPELPRVTRVSLGNTATVKMAEHDLTYDFSATAVEFIKGLEKNPKDDLYKRMLLHANKFDSKTQEYYLVKVKLKIENLTGADSVDISLDWFNVYSDSGEGEIQHSIYTKPPALETSNKVGNNRVLTRWVGFTVPKGDTNIKLSIIANHNPEIILDIE